MANPISRGARGRGTSGREFTAHAPLPPAKGAADKMVDATDKLFLRVRANDSILNHLGLPLANIREIYAIPSDSANAPDPIVPIRKVVADKISANPWTIILLPGTQIKQGKYVWYQGANAPDSIPDTLELKTIQIFLPTYIQAWRVISWLSTGRKDYDLADGSKSPQLAGMTTDNYDSIIGVTTPRGITYNFDSILYEKDVPPTDPTDPTK